MKSSEAVPAQSVAIPKATEIPSSQTLLSISEVLQISAMRRLCFAQLISNFGDVIAIFGVISVLTFRLNGSPQQVNGLQIAYLLPIAVLGVVAGVFVDRWPLKITMVASDFVRASLVLLLLSAHTLWHYYLVLTTISVVSSFFNPAQAVAVRSVVPTAGLRSANSLMQQVLFVTRIIGPALAALLVSTFGPVSCYLADVISFLGSGVTIATIAFKPRPSGSSSPQIEQETGPHRIGSVVSGIREGLQFIWHHANFPFIVMAFSAAMFVVASFAPLIAIYVRDSLHGSNRFFGLASAMIGVGIFLGVNVLNAWGKKLKDKTLVILGLGEMAFALAILTAWPHLISTIVGNLIVGCGVASILVPANTMIQMETPAALMGRVNATVMSLVFASQIAGLVLSGSIANYIGVRHVFALCSALLMLLVVCGKVLSGRDRVADDAIA